MEDGKEKNITRRYKEETKDTVFENISEERNKLMERENQVFMMYE